MSSLMLESAHDAEGADERIEPPPFVEYDGVPLVEMTIDEAEYRLDVGKQGTALGISRRAVGTYGWEFLGEVRWDGSTLRSRAFDRPLLEQLGRGLAEAVAEAD